MAVLFIPLWKEAPFLRIILPFIAGIVWQCYLPALTDTWVRMICIGLIGVVIFSFFAIRLKFRWRWCSGSFINVVFIAWGGLMTAITVPPTQVQAPYIVSITAPLAEKPKTWKAEASGNIVIYFKKDKDELKLGYGNRIMFLKTPEKLSERYSRVFLGPTEYVVLPGRNIHHLQSFLFDLQKWVVNVLQRFIKGQKECGLAEALLIGYKNDLDREMMKAYANTGVVHVVAISGLHLGLIYMMLKGFCFPLANKRIGRWLTAAIVITGLWFFSLLAGGSPSVIRSAVMFTFIIAGENFSKKSSIYNNLAASAFLLLCYEPQWLWDIGFQLSYLALLSIVMFQKPIYHLFVFKNKIADAIWKLNAVTLAAQLLTTPICIYYFHQFPNLFLATNFIAVPLSSVILIGEISLCLVAGVPAIAGWLGIQLSHCIWFMNSTVEWLGSFRYSTTNNVHINVLQLFLLYGMIAIVSRWIFTPHRK